MKIQIPDIMRPVIGGIETVEVKGKTVREGIKALEQKFPELKPRLYDDQGQLFRYIDFFVNNQDIGTNLDFSVKDDDEVFILVTILGG
jgi:molybdopterin converting factor small subunit